MRAGSTGIYICGRQRFSHRESLGYIHGRSSRYLGRGRRARRFAELTGPPENLDDVIKTICSFGENGRRLLANPERVAGSGSWCAPMLRNGLLSPELALIRDSVRRRHVDGVEIGKRRPAEELMYPEFAVDARTRFRWLIFDHLLRSCLKGIRSVIPGELRPILAAVLTTCIRGEHILSGRPNATTERADSTARTYRMSEQARRASLERQP